MTNGRMGIWVAAMLVCTGCQASESMTLDDVLQRHASARGGAEAIEQVTSIRFELEITEPGWTLRGVYVATRAGHMRIDVFAGDERVFTEALGPDGGWQLGQGETVGTEMIPKAEQVLQRGIVGNLYGLHELTGQGYTVSLLGTEVRNQSEYIAIEWMAPGGHVRRLLLDPETFLIASQVETKALHPDLDPTETEQETFVTDYRATGGVLYSRHSQKLDLESGKIIQTTVVKDIRVNPVIDGAVFLRPR